MVISKSRNKESSVPNWSAKPAKNSDELQAPEFPF
jgi:hypothetical protein